MNLYKAAAAATFLTVIALPATAVPVANNSFETGDFTGWTQFGTTGGSGVLAGNFFGVDPTDGTFQAVFGPVGSTGGISQVLATTPGLTYQIVFDLHNFGGDPNSFAVDFGGVAGPASAALPLAFICVGLLLLADSRRKLAFNA